MSHVISGLNNILVRETLGSLVHHRLADNDLATGTEQWLSRIIAPLVQ